MCNKTLRNAKKLFKKYDLDATLVRASKHYIFELSRVDGGTARLTVASSGSDVRGMKNTEARVRAFAEGRVVQ